MMAEGRSRVVLKKVLVVVVGVWRAVRPGRKRSYDGDRGLARKAVAHVAHHPPFHDYHPVTLSVVEEGKNNKR